MIETATASYYSATADIGRTPPQLKAGAERNASYYSATADIGRSVVRHGRDIFAESGIVSRRSSLPGSLLATAASAYNTQQALAPGPAKAFIAKMTGGDIRAINNQRQFLVNLRKSLGNLSARILDMQSLEAFNPNTGSSRNPNVVTASPATMAQVAQYDITIEKLAVSHQIASDKQSDPYAALNYSGAIIINGYSITISATDSIADIRDAINIGEDKNGDGILQTESEDSNGNGILDTFYQPGRWISNGTYLPSFSYSEDRDKDGILDTSEDANGNGVIDGGSKLIGVKATIEDDRLIIKSTDGANERIRIEDPDNIMFNLGFLKEDNDTRKTLKSQVDNSIYFRDPVKARFTVDGTEYTSYSNRIENVISNVDLELLSVSSEKITVTVSRDPSSAVNTVSMFASAYNDVIRQINNETIKEGSLMNNQEVQHFADSLVRESQKEVAGMDEPPRSLRDLGVELVLSGLPGVGEGVQDSVSGINPEPKAYDTYNDPAGGILARLGNMGLLSQDDFTLTIDKDKLSKQLKDNPHAVFEVFNSIDSGVGVRILNKIADAIGAPYGIIDAEISLLGYFGKNPGVVSKLMEEMLSVTENDVNRSTLGRVVA
ncbi:hypothetical protein MNBD_NITROSPINAE02-1889 [hydrothermal vent metagenome]|uniref:Filament cap protein n=1 Tax=hydrothermal vent metagenome TaxID=652676 RepID=A0A3B1CU99_9ZZZZ